MIAKSDQPILKASGIEESFVEGCSAGKVYNERIGAAGVACIPICSFDRLFFGFRELDVARFVDCRVSLIDQPNHIVLRFAVGF